MQPPSTDHLVEGGPKARGRPTILFGSGAAAFPLSRDLGTPPKAVGGDGRAYLVVENLSEGYKT